MSEGSETRHKSGIGGRLAMWIIGPLLVLAIGVVALVRNPPKTLLLGKLAKQFRAQTGYELSYGARSSIALWPQARLDLRNVKIRRPALPPTIGGVVADAKRLSADVDVRKLLQGSRGIDAVVIEAPTVTLHSADMRRFKAASNPQSASFELRNVTIKDGFFSYHDQPSNPEFSVSKIQAELTNASAQRIGGLKGRFEWRGAPVKLTGSMVRAEGKQSNVVLDFSAPVGMAAFKGSLFDDATTRIEGRANVRVKSIGEVASWMNVDPGPDTPALAGQVTVSGPIALSKRQVWLKGADVKSEIAEGKVDVAIDLRGARPRITGEAAWKRIDFNAFTTPRPTLMAQSIAMKPAARSGVEIVSYWEGLESYLETLNSPQGSARSFSSRAVASSVPPPPVKSPLSPKTFDFSIINWGDADLAQTAEVVLFGASEVRDVALNSRLDGGQLSLNIGRAKFAGGKWTMKLNIDGRASTPEHEIVITAGRVDAAALQNLTIGRSSVEGRSDFNANLSARGNNLDALLKSLSGKAKLELRKGRLIGLDLKAVLNCWCKRKYDRRRSTPFEAVKARLRLRNGVIKTVVPISLRGNHVELDSSGTVSLARRRLNQRLRARLAPPPSQLPIPVRISGLWNSPKVKLDFSLFSLQPSRYELPLMPKPAPAGKQRSIGVSDTDATPEKMPGQLRSKIENALSNPATSVKMPEKLRKALTRLVK